MAMKQPITEEMNLQKEWFKEAGKVKEQDLLDFFQRIVHGYAHDYGTMCHAVAACALAAAWAANDVIGLSAFQAGFVMWDFIDNWFMKSDCGLKLVNYDDMLYPQYGSKFDKVISQETWNKIRKKAIENLSKSCVAPEVYAHWENIASGNVPFGYRVVNRI